MTSQPGPHGPRRWLAHVLVLCGWACATALATAQAPASESSVKAAYLYRFMSYVEWPASSLPKPATPMFIGVAGADAVHADLQVLLASRHINGHPVVARRVAGDEGLRGLHVLFIGRGASPQRLLERSSGLPVLVITEVRQGLEWGAMLNLLPADGRVRFEAAPAMAERAGLKLGSRLLAVAERVVVR